MTPAADRLTRSRLAGVRQIALVALRLALAILFASQLSWKLPPRFGCPGRGEFRFTSEEADGAIKRSTGLCDWIGVESIWSRRERSFFAIAHGSEGKPDIALRLRGPVRVNGWFVEAVVMPHFQVFGWLIFLTELSIAVSLSLGIVSRLGAGLSLLLSIQLLLGVGGASDPATGLDEPALTYYAMILVSLVLVVSPPGRFAGVDVRVRRSLLHASGRRSLLARVLLFLT